MKCVLIGAGGHGRVLIEAYYPVEFDGILDSQEGVPSVSGVPILGSDLLLPELLNQGYTHFVVGVGSSKSCVKRASLFELAVSAGLLPQAVIHSTAWISKSATCEPGCQVLPRALIHTGVKLAENVLVNSAAVLEHDCVVGAHSHIATGAILCGGVLVGNSVHIGAGAVIRQGIRIGDHALVGAGSVVVHDVPSGHRVLGVPARPMHMDRA